ncbi:MAG: hypothetical protein KF819_05355 [Labilithrix sp.]|nr:hypothetical protein [Labilithrix sp.]
MSALARFVLRASIGALSAVLACGGSGKDAAVPGITHGDSSSTARRPLPPTSQALIGHMLGSVGERTLGPFMARSADGKAAVVAWVSGAEATSRRVVTIPLSGVGDPRGAAKTIAKVGIDTTMLVVRNVRGSSPGFAIAWTVLTDRGEALWSVVVGEDGAPRSKPIELARTTDDIVWVDIVPTDHGAVCLWAEETRGGDANVVAAALDVDGKVRGAATRVARGVAGWHALEVPGGVGVSTIAAASSAPAKLAPSAAAPPEASARASKPHQTQAGTLSFHRLDADGHPTALPVVIAAKPIVSGDVEVVRVAGTNARSVFAWTDRTGEEPSVAVASLGDDGVVVPPRHVVVSRGGAALLGLAASSGTAAVMWESPARRQGETRYVHVARVSPTHALEARSSLEVFGRAPPELAATPSGFAILAAARDCEAGSPQCPNAPVLPTLFRANESMMLVQREPFTFGTDPASMAWGMSCEREDCIALAASGVAPARIRAAEVRPRVNLKPPPDPSDIKREGPRVADLTAVVSGENIVDLAATRIGDVTVLATLAAKADAPGAKPRSGGADEARGANLVLSTRVVDGAGVASPPAILTTRALAVGGVAIAPGEKPEDGGAVAWVARDNGDPEVHVTKIDKRGRKTNEVQLTTVKGDASDVAIAWAGGGWIVAWVDSRDGNGEVYATKLGADLSRNAGERITNAPGDASDLVALVRGDLVWLAWADPRESPRDGMADVFVSAVRTKDAKRAVDEQRLLATAAHSRTPQLAASGDGAVHVAWIEEAPMGSHSPDASGYGAMWVTLDPKGKPTARPFKLPLGGEGAATSVALEPYDKGVRAIVTRSSLDAIALDGVDLGAAAPRAFPLLMLDGPPSLDVALVVEGGALFFNDDGPALADKRARRARIAWTP